MDKKDLRNLICSLTPSTTLHITFTGSKAHLTSNYTVLKIRTGKGRGGSKIMDLVDAFKNTISTGTGESDSILNVTVGGVMHGHADEASAPSTYPKNAGAAEILKRQFATLMDAEGDITVRVTSKMPELDGLWTVNQARRVQGRVGQIKLLLENKQDGRKTELWSYRHSGMVLKLEILQDDGSAKEEPQEPEESPEQFADNPDDINE